MECKCFAILPQEGMDIRQKVFVEEQGFWDEFDQQDAHSLHILVYENSKACGICRIFTDKDPGQFILGRLAVLKEERHKGYGSRLLQEAKKQALARGAHSIRLHSQMHAVPFYEANGYHTYGPVELEQDAPHIWMAREF